MSTTYGIAPLTPPTITDPVFVPGRVVPTAAAGHAILTPAPIAERWDYLADPTAERRELARFCERYGKHVLSTTTVVELWDYACSSPLAWLVIREHVSSGPDDGTGAVVRCAGTTTVTEHPTAGAAMDRALSGLGWGPLHYGPEVTGGE